MDCLHRGIEIHNCNHLDDAGVMCAEGEKFPMNRKITKS